MVSILVYFLRFISNKINYTAIFLAHTFIHTISQLVRQSVNTHDYMPNYIICSTNIKGSSSIYLKCADYKKQVLNHIFRDVIPILQNLFDNILIYRNTYRLLRCELNIYHISIQKVLPAKRNKYAHLHLTRVP